MRVAFFSRCDSCIICYSEDFYIHMRIRRRPVLDNEALVSTFHQDHVAASGTNGMCTRRQRNFLFARGEVPSTEPLFLPAREIRYEVYPCIFEDLRRYSALRRVCCSQSGQNSPDLFTAIRPSVCPRF